MNHINVTRSSMPTFEEYCEEIKELWDTRWLTNCGVKHQQLQRELCEKLSVDNIELVTNGHMALEVGIQAMGLTGEVITTPFTFASTTTAIMRNGLKPVFCDVNPVDFTMDVSKIEALITDKTSAIIPVHVYGNICDVEAIEAIAKKHGLKVLYDAAHTFGVRYKDRGIASYGDVSCFSFHATKVFNTIEGGAICYGYSYEGYGQKITELRNFGLNGLDVPEAGPNAKMNEFCAAMGLCNLRHVDEEIAKRKKVVERYRECLTGRKGLYLVPAQKDVTPNYAYLPVIFDAEEFGVNRDEVFDRLNANDINARKYFYPATNAFSCLNGIADPNATPVAKWASENVLCLPLYADLALEDVDRICDVILE